MSLSGPTLWGKLPFHLLSKILKIEKDRLDKVAKNIWMSHMSLINTHFQNVVEECNWYVETQYNIPLRRADLGFPCVVGDPYEYRGGDEEGETVLTATYSDVVFEGADPEETLYLAKFPR